MSKRRFRKIKGSCEIQVTKARGKITFKCKNIKRVPHAQEIINQIKNNKIIYK